MKRSPFHSRCTRGFTLVELLVVMGIIAILAGVIVASISSVLRFAKRTKANSACTMIQTAVQSYYTEYSVYPTADAAGGTAKDDYYKGDDSGPNTWATLIIALSGNRNPYTPATLITTNPVPNTRNIVYLSPAHSDVDSTGRMVNPFGTISAAGVASNPTTGQPFYFMAVDTDYSGVVGDTGTAPPDLTQSTVTASTKAITGGVAVWTNCDQALIGSKPGLWAHTY